MVFSLTKDYTDKQILEIKQSFGEISKLQKIVVRDKTMKDNSSEYARDYTSIDDFVDYLITGLDVSVVKSVEIDPDYGSLKITYDNGKFFDYVLRIEDNISEVTKSVVKEMKNADDPRIRAMASIFSMFKSF